MHVCELCGHERPSPCVGDGAQRTIFGSSSLGDLMWSKSEPVILVCPNFVAACRNPRGPNGELISNVYTVRMENDLCPQTVQHCVTVDFVRQYVPSFDNVDAKSSFVRAMQMAMGGKANFTMFRHE